MGEKKLYLYMNDTEYGKKLRRFLNVNRHPFLRVEAVTEKEKFWNGRKNRDSADEYWLTDDVAGAMEDAGDSSTLMVLTEDTYEKRKTISCRAKAKNLYVTILSAMALEVQAKGDMGAPMQGVYGVYAPWGEEGSMVSALLSQRLAAFGECLYVNLCEFPMLYIEEEHPDRGLGEIFFRIDSPDLESVVTKSKRKYGTAWRLPSVSHYRDLWDVDEKDMELFLKRLAGECGFSYVVVLFNDVREALPMADVMTGMFLVRRKSVLADPKERWIRYASTEKKEGIIRPVIMPSGWEEWISEIENAEPDKWMDDNDKKEFIDQMTKSEDYD